MCFRNSRMFGFADPWKVIPAISPSISTEGDDEYSSRGLTRSLAPSRENAAFQLIAICIFNCGEHQGGVPCFLSSPFVSAICLKATDSS